MVAIRAELSQKARWLFNVDNSEIGKYILVKLPSDMKMSTRFDSPVYLPS
jgi:hypothetical protein